MVNKRMRFAVILNLTGMVMSLFLSILAKNDPFFFTVGFILFVAHLLAFFYSFKEFERMCKR